MPLCRGCGNQVSERFAAVNWGEQGEVPETGPACPNCEDAKMVDGSRHEYRG